MSDDSQPQMSVNSRGCKVQTVVRYMSVRHLMGDHVTVVKVRFVFWDLTMSSLTFGRGFGLVFGVSFHVYLQQNRKGRNPRVQNVTVKL